MQISSTLVSAAVAETDTTSMKWCAVKIVYNVFTAIPHLDFGFPSTAAPFIETKTDFSRDITISYFRMSTI